MRALTLTQPWAGLVAAGLKTVESRTWGTAYRGPLAIHAAAGWGEFGSLQAAGDYVLSDDIPRGMWDAMCTAGMLEGDFDAGGVELDEATRAHVQDWPRGVIVAVAQLTAIVDVETLESDLYDREEPLCNFEQLRRAWLLGDITPVDPPVEARGAQGLWVVDPGVEQRINEAAPR